MSEEIRLAKKRIASRRWRTAKAIGRPTTYPVERVREHMLGLGISRRQMAALTGLAEQTVDSIFKPHRKRVNAHVAEPLLALRPAKLEEMAPRRYVDATGTRRRLQALMWMGWSQPEIARRIGPSTEQVHVSRWLRKPRVAAATALAVRNLYDELAGVTGPSHKTAAYARRQGWAPPAAWDDPDNPNEAPKGLTA